MPQASLGSSVPSSWSPVLQVAFGAVTAVETVAATFVVVDHLRHAKTIVTHKGSYLARQLSGFYTTGSEFVSNCMPGLRRLRKRGYTRIYTGSGLQRVTPYVKFALQCYLQ
jgi:hypothetical protein